MLVWPWVKYNTTPIPYTSTPLCLYRGHPCHGNLHCIKKRGRDIKIKERITFSDMVWIPFGECYVEWASAGRDCATPFSQWWLSGVSGWHRKAYKFRIQKVASMMRVYWIFPPGEMQRTYESLKVTEQQPICRLVVLSEHWRIPPPTTHDPIRISCYQMDCWF